MVAGEELMGWANTSLLQIGQHYDADRDVAFYHGQGSLFRVPTGYFAIFFPQDGHMPCLTVGERPQPVRKVVIKIAVNW
jgi:YhcH/YjgK/YiaL family protein